MDCEESRETIHHLTQVLAILGDQLARVTSVHKCRSEAVVLSLIWSALVGAAGTTSSEHYLLPGTDGTGSLALAAFISGTAHSTDHNHAGRRSTRVGIELLARATKTLLQLRTVCL
jgi:hypothetical protein